MYYYFDGKEDLYAYVVEVGLARLFAAGRPAPRPAETDAEAFWSSWATTTSA